MASLRLPCFPSTSYFSTEQQHQHQHQQQHLNTLFSLPRQQNQPNNNNKNYSCSISCWLSYNHTFPIKPIRGRSFVSPFSATTHEPVATSSSSNFTIETSRSEQEEEEEYSKDRLIAQNVPWTSTAEDIRALFEKHGTVLDVELSMHNKTMNRGLAFVTMGSPEEAHAAFNGLQSYEFEGRTLRINYAKPKKKKAVPASAVEPKPVPMFNLFVANLSFEARAKDLKALFSSEGYDVISAEVIFHDNPRRSSGYGFVSFKTKKQAQAALSAFQAKEFMGRPIRVAPSRQFVKLQTKESLDRDGTSDELNTDDADTTDEIET